MQYLGEISGNGMLKCGGVDIATAFYEFESFLLKSGGSTRSGDITLAPEALKSCFRKPDVQLLADDGRMFNLTFAEKHLREQNTAQWS